MVVSVGKMPPEDLIHEVDIPLYPVPSVVHHRELQRLSEYLGLLGRNWCTPHTSAIWLPHIRVALHDLRSAVYLRVLASVGSLGGWYFPDDIEGRHRDEVVQVCKEMVRNGDLIGTRSWPESGPRAFGYALSRPILRLSLTSKLLHRMDYTHSCRDRVPGWQKEYRGLRNRLADAFSQDLLIGAEQGSEVYKRYLKFWEFMCSMEMPQSDQSFRMAVLASRIYHWDFPGEDCPEQELNR